MLSGVRRHDHIARPLRGLPPPLVLLGAATAIYILVLARLLPVGADDFGIAGVFSTDEQLAGRIVHGMLTRRTLNPDHFFAYGALYHELTALLLAPFRVAGLGERGVLVGLRTVALLSGAATLALTYALGARLFGAWAGLLAALLIACSAELLAWSVTAHPDTLQLALLTGGVLAVCGVRDRPSRPRIALAALLAGLAFGTKYAGVMLLPLLGLAVACGHVARPCHARALVQRLAGDALLVGGVFLLTFVLTNPYAVVEWRRFIAQVRGELAHARVGHVVIAAEPRVRWLGRIAERSFAGPLVPVAAALGWAAVVLARPAAPTEAAESRGRSSLRAVAARIDGPVLVGLWTFGYLAYLVAVVGYQAPRYALPVLPGLAVLAAGGAAWLGARRQAWGIAAAAVLLTVTATLATAPLSDLYRERAERMTDAGANARVLAGRWLQAHAPADAALLSDAYVYVPSSLRGVKTTFGLTEQQIADLRPVLIVVNEDIRGRFRDPDRGARYVDGAAAYAARAEAYARLEAGTLGCYRLVQDFGGVRIFADERALREQANHGCGTAR